MPEKPYPRQDLDHILDHTRQLWQDLRGQRLFITGGTGFFGTWLLESLAWANDRLGLNVQAVVLTRNPSAFQNKAPHLANHSAVRLIPGEVSSFSFPSGSFAFVIHAANPGAQDFPPGDFDSLQKAIVTGAQHVLDFALQSEVQRFLFTSSGAVYGPQPPDLDAIPEDLPWVDPIENLPSSARAYREGKRFAEQLCLSAAMESDLEVVISRCFAFVGPGLPLDANFAIGNFIRDGLAGGPIVVKGDGTAVRSYLYAADLAIWLWTLLLRGQSGQAYNVGSDVAISIRKLANIVAHSFIPSREVQVLGYPAPGMAAQRYVPETHRSQEEQDLQAWVALEKGILHTIGYHTRLL